MARKSRSVLAFALSAALALGTIPTPALAEMAEEAMGTVEAAAPAMTDRTAKPSSSAPAGQATTVDEGELGTDGAPTTPNEPAPAPATEAPADTIAELGVQSEATPAPATPSPAVLSAQAAPADLATQSTLASGTWGSCPWELDSNGVLTVFPGEGENTNIHPSEIHQGEFFAQSPWYENRFDITAVRMVEQDGAKVVLPSNCTNLFAFLVKAKTIDLSGADTSHVENMEHFFYECPDLTSIDFSGWDSSNVTNMSSMFEHCLDLTSLNISGWDTSKVQDMSEMFKRNDYITALDLSGWNTAAVTNFSEMFNGCSALSSLNVSGWDTSAVTSSADMFTSCSSLARLVVGDGFTLHGAIPANTVNDVDGWYSDALHRLLTTDEFVARTRVADTYTKRPVDGDTDISNATVTLPATSYAYDGKAKTPAPTVKLGDTTLTEGTDYGVTYTNNIHIGTATVTIQGWGAYKGTCTATFQIAADVSGARVSYIPDKTYTGSAFTPPVSVTLDGRALNADTDYDVSYSNNVNAGTATVTIRGKGDYVGSKNVGFRITRMPIEAPVAVTGLVYDGTERTGVPEGEGYELSGDIVRKDVGTYTAIVRPDGNHMWEGGSTDALQLGWSIAPKSVTISGKTVTKVYGMPDPELVSAEGLVGEDTVSYAVYRVPGEGCGEYEISLYGVENQGNYTVTYTPGKLTIVQANISDTEVDPIATQMYTSFRVEPKPVVRMGSATLVEDTDYDLSYENNEHKGVDTASVTITGKGNYTGSKTLRFSIGSRDLSFATISLDRELIPASEVPAEPTVTAYIDGSWENLAEHRDFTVSYHDNDKVGQAKAVVVGMGDWAGTVELPFEIAEKVDISDPRSHAQFWTLGEDGSGCTSFLYRGAPVRPKVSMGPNPLARGNMVEGRDYEVSYLACDGPGNATAVVRGIGDYTGEQRIAYTIMNSSGLSLSNATVTLENPNATLPSESGGERLNVYLRKDGVDPKPVPRVTVGGATLVEGVDYEVDYQYEGHSSNDQSQRDMGLCIVRGINGASGEAQCAFCVVDRIDVAWLNLSESDLEQPQYHWEDEPVEPKLIPRDDFKEGRDYSLSYSNNDDYEVFCHVTVTGQGRYYGSATIDAFITKDLFFTPYSDCELEVVEPEGGIVYDGSEKRPEVRLVDPWTGKALVENLDYSVSYADNVAAGTAVARVRPAAATTRYAGYIETTFQIAKAPSAMTAAVVRPQILVSRDPLADQVVSSSNITVSGATRHETYENVSADATAKGFSIGMGTGFLTVPKGTSAGTYRLDVKVTDEGDQNHAGKAVTLSYDVVVGNHISPATATLDGTDWSAVYDPVYYAAKNPDVADWAKGTDGTIDGNKLLGHFVNSGRKEGRASKAGFELASYYNANADLRRAYGTDWARYYDHYRASGKREGRACAGVTALRGAVTSRDGVDWAPVYDALLYAQRNPDVASWATRKFSSGSVLDDAALLSHFVNSGTKECRSGKASFDVRSYYNANPDLRASFAGTSDWSKYYRHYATSGAREGRRCAGTGELVGSVNVLNGTNWSAVYDRVTYGQRNADIATWATRKCGSATVLDDYAMLSHFVNNGRKEGRSAKASFELASYFNANPDLRRAFGTDWARYYDHYRGNGQREGRTCAGVRELRGAATTAENVNWAPVYDALYYAQHNSDVANWARRRFASGSVLDDAALLSHFVNSGTKEARASKAGFDVRAYKSKNADLASAFGSDWKSYYRHYAKFGVNEHRACV